MKGHTILNTIYSDRTIVALCTPAGSGALAIIRISGRDAFRIVDACWRGKKIELCASHTAHLGQIMSADGETIDEVVATVFRNPRSFTGDDTVEISCHGSQWIASAIVDRLVELGAVPASPGEFSQRAFTNGRIDLAQAEGIADLIAADSRAAHRLAMTQARGQFSANLDEMRNRLIDLASLLELELDFSEEDVEFADRTNLLNLTDEILDTTTRLSQTYRAGKAFKEGVPTVIAGVPNAGKSTLLNNLLCEEKAIVSDIAGTTRDVIEDTAEIQGILFRFYDTAGLRTTDDTIEQIGVQRARAKLADAHIVILVIDATAPLAPQLDEIGCHLSDEADIIALINKADIATPEQIDDIMAALSDKQYITITGSANDAATIEALSTKLAEISTRSGDPHHALIVTNARHYESLLRTADALREARTAILAGLSADLIAPWVRTAADALGAITGTISADTLLHTIFSRFCIGK